MANPRVILWAKDARFIATLIISCEVDYDPPVASFGGDSHPKMWWVFWVEVDDGITQVHDQMVFILAKNASSLASDFIRTISS